MKKILMLLFTSFVSIASFSQNLKSQYVEVEEGGFYGIRDSNGKIIVPCNYTFIYSKYYQDEKYFEVKDINRLYGVYNSKGQEIIPCKYQRISFEKDYIRFENKEGKEGIADYNGNIILGCVSNFIYDRKNFLIYQVGGRWVKGNIVEAKYGLISLKPLKILSSAQYDEYEEPGNYTMISLDGKWGVVDSTGTEIVKPQYTFIHLASDNLFTVNTGGQRTESHQTIGGKWGLVDSKGNTLIPCQYDEPIIFKQDVAMVKKDGEVKLIKNPLVDKSAVTIADGTVASYKKKASGPAVSRYPAPDSDVDKDIPQASKKSENTFAFVVANENYPDAPVPYALNDGRMFAQYCEKTLGIPQKNINLYEDATYGNIVTMIDKIKNVASAFEGEASILLYYAGHGFPDEKQGSAYLLPIDGSGSEISTTGYSLKHLYDELSRLPLKRAVVLLDACFSGAKREDDMLAQSRGVAIKVKEEQPKGHLLVFSASQGDETAHQMAEKHHGLFTYYLLKGMQQLRGNTNWGDLTDFVTKNVKRQSVVINNKKQTPTVIPSSEIFNTWRTIHLQ